MSAERDPLVSVVLRCRNSESTLPRQLDALAQQAWAGAWELLLVDNGSTDASVEVARSYADRLPLRILSATERAGGAYGLNVGVRAARAPAALFCDSDDEVGDGWLATMSEALRTHDLVACRHDVEALNPRWLRGSREPAFAEALPRLAFPPYLPHATSSAMGVARRVFDELGGFDETVAALHDTDFAVRAGLAGYTIHFVPDAVVRYRYRASPAGIFDQARAYAQDMALLQRRYVPAGAPVPGRRTWLVEGWKPVLRALPRAGTRAGRARLAWLLGWQAGRYAGSVRYRVLAV